MLRRPEECLWVVLRRLMLLYRAEVLLARPAVMKNVNDGQIKHTALFILFCLRCIKKGWFIPRFMDSMMAFAMKSKLKVGVLPLPLWMRRN